MKKSDLKNGCVVEVRNGNKYFKIDNTLINSNFRSWASLDFYNEDLTRREKDEKEYDIMKVNNEVENIFFDGCYRAISQVLDDKKDVWTWVREGIKLTDEEKEILKALKVLGFNYIAKDECKLLYAYTKLPSKRFDAWGGSGEKVYRVEEISLDFIKWEDEKPYSIEDLLNL